MPKPYITPELKEEPSLAENIAALSSGVESLLASGLNRKATIILLSEATGISRTAVNQILFGITELRSKYTKL